LCTIVIVFEAVGLKVSFYEKILGKSSTVENSLVLFFFAPKEKKIIGEEMDGFGVFPMPFTVFLCNLCSAAVQVLYALEVAFLHYCCCSSSSG